MCVSIHYVMVIIQQVFGEIPGTYWYETTVAVEFTNSRTGQ